MTHAEFDEIFSTKISPLKGPTEELCVSEIVHAAWRLRRCAEASDTLEITDPKFRRHRPGPCPCPPHHRTLPRRTPKPANRASRPRQRQRPGRSRGPPRRWHPRLSPTDPHHRRGNLLLRMTTRRLHGVETIEKVIHNSVPQPEPAQPEPDKLASSGKNLYRGLQPRLFP